MDEVTLAKLFRKLGAPDPASWAHSQVAEEMPQLARFLFLREAWKRVVPDGGQTWIAEQLKVDVNKPGGGIVPALKRVLALGAEPDDQ
jgi:hypothetical protein